MKMMVLVFLLAAPVYGMPFYCRDYDGETQKYISLYYDRISSSYGLAVHFEVEDYCGFTPCMKTLYRKNLQNLICRSIGNKIHCKGKVYSPLIERNGNDVILTMSDFPTTVVRAKYCNFN